MQALIVRPMLPADLAAAAAIEACAPEAWTAGQLTEELAAQQAGGAPRLFVAAGEAGLLGLAVYQLAAGEANLCTLTVAPAARRQGVGRALLGYAEAWAKAQGKRALRLDVHEINTPAIKLYESCGFRYIATVDLGYGAYGLKWFRLYEKLL